MKLIYLKNKKKEIVFSKIVKNEEVKSFKTELMKDKKLNGCRGFIVNLDAYEGLFIVNVDVHSNYNDEKKDKSIKAKNG